MRRAVPAVPIAVLISAFALVAFAASAAESTGHNRYKWRDEIGNLHYSDALPAEAARLGYDVVNPQGVVIRHVDRAKTAQELAVAKAAAAKSQAERDEADRRQRADSQLVAAYPSEADLKRAQQQQLEMLGQQINAAQISLRNQEGSLADLLARAADAERGGKTLPDAQAKQLADMRKQVDDQRAAVQRKQAERDGASTRFDADLAHYRELRAKSQGGAPAS